MDPIEDREIAPLWGEHYPKWRQNIASKTAPVSRIVMILEKKAPQVAAHDDLIDKLHRLLERFGIPQEQFYEVEKELGDIKTQLGGDRIISYPVGAFPKSRF